MLNHLTNEEKNIETNDCCYLICSYRNHQSLAFPRDILKMALLSNSGSICVGHNHLSGSVTVSIADIEFTAKSEKACRLLQINFREHLIIGSDGSYLSMKAEGYITDSKEGSKRC